MSDFIKKMREQEKSKQATLDTKMKDPSSSQPAPSESMAKAPHIKNWDNPEYFGNMSQERKDLVNFGGDTDQVFMNALNGHYRAFINSNKKIVREGSDEKSIPKQFDNLGKKAWDIAKLAKHGTTKDDLNKLFELKKEFQKDFVDANTAMYTYGKDYGMVFDKNYRMVDPERLSEHSQQTVIRKESSTDQEVKVEGNYLSTIFKAFFTASNPAAFGGSNVQASLNYMLPGTTTTFVENKNSAWKKIKTQEGDMRDLLTAAYSPVVENWVGYSYANWSNDRFGSETGKFDNRERLVALGTTALEHVSKYGSAGGNDHEATAVKLIKELNKISDAKERQQFFKTNELDIKNIINGMGFYGKSTVTRKYKSEFSSEYYPAGENGDKKATMTSFLNEVETLSAQKQKTDEVFAQIKLKARDAIKGGHKIPIAAEVFDMAFDKSGNLRSYDNVRKDWESKYGPTNPSYYIKGDQGDRTGYGDSYNLKSMLDHIRIKYHEKFNDLNSHQIFSESLLLAGLGKNRSQHIGHDNIDFKVDSAKNKNAHVIKNMVLGGLESGKIYAKSGMLKPTDTESGLSSTANTKRVQMFNAFFDNDTKYDVAFSVNSSIKDKSAYIFTTKGKNPKTMTFYVNTRDAVQQGEEYAMNTYTSPQEYSYKLSGRWDLSAWSDQYEYADSPNIVTKGGLKYLKASLYSLKEGMPKEELILLGQDQISIEIAEQRAKTFLDTYEETIRTNLK